MKDRSEELFELLKDPIRSRIMFEFMINRRVTINSLSNILNKDRTTINYHLNMFLSAGIIKEVDKISHTRGKPTIVYGLTDVNYKIEKEVEDETNKLQESLMDQSRSLNMLAAISEQSYEMLSEIHQNLTTEHHMLIMHENEITEFYSGLFKYITDFMTARKESPDLDSINETEKSQKYVYYTGFFPIIRDQ